MSYFNNKLFESKITESEAYRKYLFHKDISEHRPKRQVGVDVPLNDIVRGLIEVRYEEEKVSMAEKLHRWRDAFVPKPDYRLELEETKKIFEEEIAEILCFMIKIFK